MRRAPELERNQAPEEIPSSIGRKVGLTPAQLDALADHSTSPAYGELKRLGTRYAEQLTVAGDVAAANFSNRLNSALRLDLERPQT